MALEMYKKIMICLIIMLNFGVMVFAETPKLIVSEEFENYYSGAPIGWTASTLGISPVKLNSKQGRGAKLQSSDLLFDANMQMMFSPPLTGKIVLEAKVIMPDVLHKRALFTFKDSSNRENLSVIFSSNGFICLGAEYTKLTMYQPDKWYYLQMQVDLDKKMFDLYINGVKKAENQPLYNQEISNINLLRFGQWDKDNAYFYIDDIVVYQSEKVYSQEEQKKIFSITFDDVDNHWAKEQIAYFAKLKLLNKTEDNKFRPDDTIKNSEFVLLIQSIMRFATREYVNLFVDVTKKSDCATAVQALVDAGIICGDGDKFNPDKSITLQQASVTLCEVYKFSKQELPGIKTINFKNLQEKGVWAQDYIGQAKILNLYNGISRINKSNIDINMEITRAEYIVMMKNLLGAINK